jgi:hypothetical protein
MSPDCPADANADLVRVVRSKPAATPRLTTVVNHFMVVVLSVRLSLGPKFREILESV